MVTAYDLGHDSAEPDGPRGHRMNRTYPDRPFVGVGALIFRGDSILLVKRGKPPREGQWSIPGGIQHTGETVFEAARREVREETNLEVEIKEIVAVVDSIVRDETGQVKYHYTLVDVMAECNEGDARAGDDAAEVAWVPLDALEPYRLWRETVRIIQLAAGRRGAAVVRPAPGEVFKNR
jgi:ADP-ribose pyrophosphatase YjhB (NUDIX family)